MAGTTVTTLAKKKMVKARAGISSLPKIVGMAFGDGLLGCNLLLRFRWKDELWRFYEELS